MQTEKAHWVKYSNKIFPRYVRKLFLVKIGSKKFVGFHNFENAIIYEKLMKVHNDINQDGGEK